MMPEAKTYNGKKLVIWLGIGFFFFTLIGLILTYVTANAMTPYLRHKFEQSQRHSSPAK